MGATAAEITAIEAELQRQRTGRWRRLEPQELRGYPRGVATVGWAIDFAPAELRCAEVTEVDVYLDDLYPHSQPHVFSKRAFNNFNWPHVEFDGMLCLPKSISGAEGSSRIIQHLAWACEVLDYSATERRQEFEREFGSYWAQKSIGATLQIVSLVNPNGPSRRIATWTSENASCLVVAEDAGSLEKWVINSGKSAKRPRFQSGWLTWLSRPWIPEEFPDKLAGLIDDIPDTELRFLVEQQTLIPLVYGAQTTTGPALVGLIVNGSQIQKILRPQIRSRPVALHKIRRELATSRISRVTVARADGNWVHGRGKDSNYSLLADQVVTVVGCGAIGGGIARLLAQSGVGSFLLVDPDNLNFANTSRHVLGSSSVGGLKAKELAKALLRDFPHLQDIKAEALKFERVGSDMLRAIARSNLIVSAGTPFSADAAIDIWRRKMALSLPHVCAWSEEFALAGHSVSRFNDNSILDLFNNADEPRECATYWPDGVNTTEVEAGCGNAFQPHGAADLQPIIAMATRMCIGVLRGGMTGSSHRLWLGDRERVTELGGIALDCFDRSFGERDL